MQDGAIRIGYQRNGVLFLAKERGAFEKAVSAKVTWAQFQAGPPLLEAIGVGSVDLGATGDAPPIFAQAAGAGLVYAGAVALSGAAGGVLTPAKSGLTTIADLKGKKLAFTRGSSAHNQAVVALAQAGLTLKDVEPVNLSPADAAAALAQGGIDGWVIWDPFYTAAQIDQGARVLARGETLGGSAQFILARREFAEKQPVLLSAALDALAAEGRWADQNRPAVAEMMAKETQMPLSLLQNTVARESFLVGPITPEIVARQQEIADRFLELGVLPKAVTIADAAWTGWAPGR
jgi:aliphatic sulfonates family ABC transporter substrate-binding protein